MRRLGPLLRLFALLLTANNAVAADPLRITVRAGQLTYKDFSVFIEKQGASWVTQLILDGEVDLTKSPPYAQI